MSDLTLPLIGLTTLVGYFFSRDGRNPRATEVVREKIEEFDKPNGKTIYTSNVVNKANDEILKRSLQNYKAAENPSDTGFIPPLYNTYSVVGNDSLLSPILAPEITGLSSEQLGKLNDINRLKNVKESSSSKDKIDTMPMFKPLEKYVGRETTDTQNFSLSFNEDQDAQINLLTNKPFEKSHANMVPFFGSNTKQNVEMFSNQSLLDNHTGNTSTFKHKKETESFYDKNPENIYGNPVFATQVDTDRYIPSLYRQNEKPIEQVRVSAQKAGTIDNNIRPTYKDVNELRPGNKPKETYKGRTIFGQLGEVRGIHGKVVKNKPDTFFENDYRFNGPGEFTAPRVREDYSENMKASSRESYNMEYYGGGNSQIKSSVQRLGVDNSSELSFALFQEPKRQNYEGDYSRNINGTILNNQNTADYGRSSMKQYESERATTGDKSHLLNAKVSNAAGPTIKPQDDIRKTLKETTMYESNGQVSTAYNKGSNSAYNAGISDITAKATQKQSLVENKYKGQVHKDDGMGYIVNKYEAKTTGKELVTNNSSNYVTNAGKIIKNAIVHSTFENPERVRNALHYEYKGNAGYASETASRTKYDNAVIRDNKQELLMGERPSGPQQFQIVSGKDSQGDIKLTDNMLLKEQQDSRSKITNDYKHIPSKEQVGTTIKHRKDNGVVENNRFQPDLVHSQLSNNPFVINSSKMI
jgi:hypothetical protein